MTGNKRGESVKEYLEALVGISYHEWQRLKLTIDEEFRSKEGELKRELKFSGKENTNYSDTI